MSQNNFITYGQNGISPRVGIYLPPKMLANAQPWLILDKVGGALKTPLPKNKGDTIKWRRAVPFDVTTNTLVEGVTPNPQNFQFEDVTDNIDEYGSYSVISDKVQDLHEDPVLDKIAEEMGKQIASTKELISWQTVRGGTQVIYSGTATSRGTVEDVIQIEQVRAAVATLKGNHADMITSRINASTGYSTEPVGASYVGVGNSDQQYDFEDLDGFVPVEKYGQFKPLSDYELGKVRDVRIVLSPQEEPFYGAGSATTTGVLSRDGANVDVYPFIIMGKEFWGTTDLSGAGSVGVHVEPPGKMTKDDPLGQRGFAAWKFWFCATRLNERWGVRIEAAATDWAA
jgi:N4-gp56 family major capsid protein